MDPTNPSATNKEAPSQNNTLPVTELSSQESASKQDTMSGQHDKDSKQVSAFSTGGGPPLREVPPRPPNASRQTTTPSSEDPTGGPNRFFGTQGDNSGKQEEGFRSNILSSKSGSPNDITGGPIRPELSGQKAGPSSMGALDPYRTFKNQGSNDGQKNEVSRNDSLSDFRRQKFRLDSSPDIGLVPIGPESSGQKAPLASEGSAGPNRFFGSQNNSSSKQDDDGENVTKSDFLRRGNFAKDSPDFEVAPVEGAKATPFSEGSTASNRFVGNQANSSSKQDEDGKKFYMPDYLSRKVPVAPNSSGPKPGPSFEGASNPNRFFGNQGITSGKKEEDLRTATLNSRNGPPANDTAQVPFRPESSGQKAPVGVVKAPQDMVNISQGRTNSNVIQKIPEPKLSLSAGSSGPGSSKNSEGERLGPGSMAENSGNFSKGGTSISNSNHNSMKQNSNQNLNPGDSVSRMIGGASVGQTKINPNPLGANNTLDSTQMKKTSTETTKEIDSATKMASWIPQEQDKPKTDDPSGRFPHHWYVAHNREINKNRVGQSEGSRVSLTGMSQDSTDNQHAIKRNVIGTTQERPYVDSKSSSHSMAPYPSLFKKFGLKGIAPPVKPFYFSRSPSPPDKMASSGVQPSPPERKSEDSHVGPPRLLRTSSPPNFRPLNDASSKRPEIRELRVEDALSYLDRVKIEFADRPNIYNEFLGIMKDFKAHILDTPGVIMKVSQLFRGYNHLILGFNMFLPDGFRISIKDLMQGGKYAGESPPTVPQVSKSESIDPFSHFPHGMPREQPPPTNPFFVRGGLSLGTSPSQGHMLSGMKDNAISSQGSHPQQSQMGMHHQATHNAVQEVQQNGQEDEGNFIEFDHAITFVTKIKRRFVHEPRVYQQFLEILHTYQKEQRGIKDVLEKVSALFADHPDLLKQFTYFLPEAVQEQAKERLNAAAAEAEARKMAAHTMETPQEVQSQSQTTKERDMEVTMDMTVKEPELIQAPPSEEKRPPSPPNVTLQYPLMPETLIYNSGVERQFFDLAKESLRSSSREGDLAWAEFLKCMDLYAQEILSKNDMLKYMEDLLGKQHIDLFEEFKRILSAAGAAGAPSHDEAWHSVPLSEIDFSRCRRCTPSYRALPRDYPAPPFSGRSADEAKLLNDVWISLPDGSEESYTFRHMRKNQHEEVLFRCEDERFEIDMVIDSTATALNRLEPIAEEIAMLQGKEDFSGRNTTDGNGLKTARENGGIGGKTMKYSFNKCVLNTIHRHAITRIYGESGQEMLDLMQKNPVVAIPVVVKRLKQKYKDFRAAREVLNRRWKELAEINYYKSIDHRSLTWRAVDKRATSTRTLAAEIKDRAANEGFESEATILAKRDKAKEEFGSFYERTMGRFLPRKMDLTGLPKPDPSIFTPHYSMSYENNSWAQRDAYRIISFALERGSTSPTDKERCHRLWIDFLAPFFDLSSIWIRAPAAAYAALPHHHAPTIVSNGDESANEDDESSAEDENEMLGNMMVTEEVMKECNAENNHVTDFCLLDNQPIPSGASVSTVYGDGTVVEYRTSDNVFVVSLQCGPMAFLNRNAVLCTILPVDPYNDLEHPIETDEDPLERDNDKFILGPQSLYLFFRLHQILINRLNTAKKLAHTVDKDQSLSTLIEQIISDGSEHVGQKRYEAFLCLVYGLFDGVFNPGAGSNSAEGGKYEDRVRCLLGHNAYELATMDKLVSHILKHLQNLANDDTMQGMIQIFRKHLDSGAFKPQAFRQEAALISEGENIYAFQYCHTPESDNAIMHIELLGCIAEVEDEESVTSVPDSNDGPASKKQRR